MANRYVQNPVTTGVTRFTRAPMANVEFSRMTADPTWQLPFNAGDIVPVYYAEVLPHDTFSVDLDFVIRQMTALHPTMGQMQVDFFAYFVPNRIINDSWKNVQGENTSGFWSAPEVSLAPLYREREGVRDVQIPVGSVADYYGFPTQLPIKASLLARCNDLKFKGYLSIYNHYFRDENYQSPISFSTLNLYQGFLEPVNSVISVGPVNNQGYTSVAGSASGSYAGGALVKAIIGDGAPNRYYGAVTDRLTSWSALDKPLKANKLHDVFTSGLPSPQKGPEVFFGIAEDLDVPLVASSELYKVGDEIKFGLNNGSTFGTNTALGLDLNGVFKVFSAGAPTELGELTQTNLRGLADLSNATGVSVNDLRVAVATQQVYETLARGGSRYVETLRSFFGIETENPFLDIPTELGHIRRELDLYQVAQTSATGASGTDTPQGELTAFGYTTSDGHLFTRTFLEHGYIHVMAIVRQRNLYSSYFAPDNFRLSTLDFYLPQLANIGEQPIRLATLNPFVDGADEKVLAYQEAWWEYRYEPDRVHGLFRTGVNGNLSMWNYADEFDPRFEVITGDWLKSNAEEVMNRTIAVTSELEPQLKGLFKYKVTKQRPLPTYSVPGLDTI